MDEGGEFEAGLVGGGEYPTVAEQGVVGGVAEASIAGDANVERCNTPEQAVGDYVFLASYDSSEAFIVRGRKPSQCELPSAPDAGRVLDRNHHTLIVSARAGLDKGIAGKGKVGGIGGKGSGASGCASGARG